MSSSTALTTAPKLYEPRFNPDTNTYEDECPWVKGWRGRREPHKCFCNANVTFNTRAVFKQHILSGKHKEALKDYNSEKDEVKSQIKEFHIKIDQLERAKNKLSKANAKLTEGIEKANKHIERQSVIIISQKQEALTVAESTADELAKQKTKHRKRKNKLSEMTDYLAIVETENNTHTTKISELEAYIKIIESTPQSPPPTLSLPRSPPPAPRKKSPSEQEELSEPEEHTNEEEQWHDVSDED
jgi:hypothetical protein